MAPTKLKKRMKLLLALQTANSSLCFKGITLPFCCPGMLVFHHSDSADTWTVGDPHCWTNRMRSEYLNHKLTLMVWRSTIPGIRWTMTWQCHLLQTVPVRLQCSWPLRSALPVSKRALLRVTRWALFTNIDLSSPAMAALRYLARRGLRLLPCPMDGHCLLHSVCSSWQSQLSYFTTIDL